MNNTYQVDLNNYKQNRLSASWTHAPSVPYKSAENSVVKWMLIHITSMKTHLNI